MIVLIAEALDERKKLRTALTELQQMPTTVDEDEEEEAAKTAATESLEKVEIILSRIQELSVSINRRNSETKIAWEDGELSIMEAVSLRDRLVTEHRFYDGLLDSQESALKPSRRWGAARSKDDVKVKPVIEPKALRMARDQAAKTVAALDNAIQKVNWTVEL
jgi:hypothetical protein